MTKMRIGKKKSTREEIGVRNIDALAWKHTAMTIWFIFWCSRITLQYYQKRQ